MTGAKGFSGGAAGPGSSAVLARFPDAEILEVKETAAAAETGGEMVEEPGPLAD